MTGAPRQAGFGVIRQMRTSELLTSDLPPHAYIKVAGDRMVVTTVWQECTANSPMDCASVQSIARVRLPTVRVATKTRL